MTDDTPDMVDTGFGDVLAGNVYAHPEPADVTVAVTDQSLIPADEKSGCSLTPEGVEAAKSLLRLPVISPADLARLAREFALNIKERHVVLREFKLDEAQYEFLEKNNEFYKAALHAACIEWQGPLSTPDRLRIQAAAILEDSLPGLGARMQNKGEGLPGVVETAKLFAKVAGVGEREAGARGPGERFSINIDLGGDKKITLSSGPGEETNPNEPARLAIAGLSGP